MNAKRELERNLAAVAKLPSYLMNYSFGALLRKVADADMNDLWIYYSNRAKQIENEIARRSGE
jgi:hypothetical protein